METAVSKVAATQSVAVPTESSPVNMHAHIYEHVVSDLSICAISKSQYALSKCTNTQLWSRQGVKYSTEACSSVNTGVETTCSHLVGG